VDQPEDGEIIFHMESWRYASRLTFGVESVTVEGRRSPMDYPSGWTCERTTRQFEPYLLSTLALLDSIAVAEHLEACDECAQTILIYRYSLTPPRRG
jgi:hypothetical protein